MWCFYHSKGKEAARKLGGDAKSKHDMAYPRLQYMFDVIDFRYAHMGKDAKGNPALITCANPEAVPKRNRCQACSRNEERFFGGKKVWELSVAQFRSLMAANAALGQHCIAITDDNSVCGREIFLVGFACSNPECGVELVSEQDLMQMSHEQIDEVASNAVVCESCTQTVQPQEIIVSEDTCPKCQGSAPVRGTLFDKSVEITAVAAPKGSGKSYNVDRSLPFSSVESDLMAFLGNEAKVAEMLVRTDMPHAFRPEYINRDKFQDDATYVAAVLDKQATKIGEENPYKAGAGGPPSQPFANARFRRPA